MMVSQSYFISFDYESKNQGYYKNNFAIFQFYALKFLMILCIKIEISRNDFYNSLGFYFHNQMI